MSNAPGYESLLHMAKVVALNTSLSISCNEHSQRNFNTQEMRAICNDGSFVIDNIRPYSKTNRPEDFFKQDERSRRLATEHPYYSMCDGTMATSFKPLEISNDVERRFGLKFQQKRRISTIETSIDIRRGSSIPNFAVVVADESNSWISVQNLKTTVTEMTCEKLAKRARYTLQFIFSSVLTRAVALSGYIRDDNDLFINELTLAQPM